MTTNELSGSKTRLLWGLAKDHAELASLEWTYGKKEWWRRFLILGSGAIFLLSSFGLFNLALVGLLLDRGFSLTFAGTCIGTTYLVLGLAACLLGRRKNRDAGGPMEESRRELKRSFEWIEKRFL